MGTGHTSAGPTAESYTLTDKRDGQTDGFVIYSDEQSKGTETSKQIQYTEFTHRETANIPVLGMSSQDHSVTSLISASVFILAEMSPTQTFTNIISNHTVAIENIFTGNCMHRI